jgi:hypothetical protein
MNGGDIVEAQLKKLTNIPTKLYKYCDFTEYNKANLCNDRVWMTLADKFNDPYDCSLTYSYEAVLNRDIEQKGIDFIFKDVDVGKFAFTDAEKIEVNCSANKIKKIMKIMISKDTEMDIDKKKHIPDFFINAIENIDRPLAEINRTKTVISCFSEINNSIIMWSHYANKHSGFCIEYDLKNYRSNVFLFPVFYEEELFDMTKYLLTEKDKFNNFALLLAAITKSIEWAYEKEWRLIPFGFVDQESDCPMSKPTALYIGSKATDDNKQWIKNVARYKKVDIYQAKMDNKKFGILFEKIIL